MSSYNLIRELAAQRGVDPDLAEAVLHQESRGKASAVSPKGAKGLMQTMPDTLRDPGFGVKPAQNNSSEEMARVGIDYLKAMHKRYNGDIGKTLAAYNAGPGRADKYGAAVPYKETRDYVSKVSSHYMRLKKGVGPGSRSTPSSGREDSRKMRPLPKRNTSLAEMAMNAAFPAAHAGELDDLDSNAAFEQAGGQNYQEFDDPLQQQGDVDTFNDLDLDDADPFAGLDDDDDEDPFAGLDDAEDDDSDPFAGLDDDSDPFAPVEGRVPDDSPVDFSIPEGEYKPSVMAPLSSDVGEAAKALGFDPSKFPKELASNVPMPKPDAYSGPGGRMFYGFERGADNLQNLAIKGFGALTGDDPQANYYRAFVHKYKQALYDQTRVAEGHNAGEFDTMALAGSMGLPMPMGKASTTLGKMGQGALAGGMGGAAYGEADIGSDDYWSQKAMGTLVGAGAGAGVAGVLQAGKYAVNKSVNTATGKMNDEAAELQKLADANKVRLLATDAMPDNKVTNTAAAVMNALPVVGTKGIRKEQNAQLAARAEQLATQAREEALATPFERLKGAAQAVKDPKSREGVSAAIQKEAGDDLGKIVGASADLMTVKEARHADKLFTKVRDLANTSGVSTDYANMNKALETQIDAMKKSKFQDSTLFDALKFASDKIKRNPSMGMQDLLETRTTVKTLLDKANDTALFTHAPQAIRALSAVKEGLDADLLKAVGGHKTKLGKALAQADEFERVVVKGREGAKLTSALDVAKETGDYDEVANLVMRPHLVDRAAKSASLLDAKGKQALLASIMQKGVDQAKSSGTGEFSPKTMAVFLNRNAKALSTLGGPDYTRQVEGYKRLLQHMNVKTHEDKMTLGSTAIAAAAGSGLYSASALASPAFWASTAGMGVLFRTEAGKRVLLASSKTPIKSERMNALINQLGQQATKAGVLTTTQQGLE